MALQVGRTRKRWFLALGKCIPVARRKDGNSASAPSAVNLKGSDIYIIVDPDTETETRSQIMWRAKDVKTISAWVKAGGVLVLMGNDVGNAEFDHFNQLARAFGIEFNKNSRNKVPGNDFTMGQTYGHAASSDLQDSPKSLSEGTFDAPGKSARAGSLCR